jgi:hypothetical protein
MYSASLAPPSHYDQIGHSLGLLQQQKPPKPSLAGRFFSGWIFASIQIWDIITIYFIGNFIVPAK